MLRQCLPTLKGILHFWRDRSMRTKLVVLLMVTTTVPILAVTHSLVTVAEARLMHSLQDGLDKDSINFGQRLDQMKNDHLLQAANLANSIRLSQLELTPNAPNAITQNPQATLLLDEIMAQVQVETKFHPSFYVITDANSRTIAQKSWSISAAAIERSLRLPQGDAKWEPPKYDIQVTPPNVDLSDIGVIKTALDSGETIASAELLSSDALIKLRLINQASMPLRPQLLNIPPMKQPFPAETFPIEQGEIGMVVMAVVPIIRGGKPAGTAIVGTLLNRNYQIVDELKTSSRISGATIFAQDLRISTNIPYHDGQTRAIATRGSREAMDQLLLQAQPYKGSTLIVNDRYQTVYQPIYDHRHEFDAKAKPIGSYLVAIKESSMQQTLHSLSTTGYLIGSGMVVVVGIMAVPMAKIFSQPLRRLAKLAAGNQQGNVGFGALSDRADEVGILARELDAMTGRMDQQLAMVQTSEQQLRQQTQELEIALRELSAAQSQLVQSEKMSSLGQLVAGVAHEINNPVNFIYGNLKHTDLYIQDLMNLIALYQEICPEGNPAIQTMLEEMDWEFIARDLPETIASMKMGADRIKEIVLSLRTFSRMDEADCKLADVEAGIDSTLTILNHRLKATPDLAEIVIRREFAGLGKVECYAGQINQVLMNLLSNAIDALESHWLQLTSPAEIVITTLDRGDATIAIMFADNGPGIAPEIRSRLFDPFFTTKEVGKGTGMGLAISYQVVVDRHGGQLTCESEMGQGTCFTIVIPRQQRAVGVTAEKGVATSIG
jgi:signal transduction histidine kinase